MTKVRDIANFLGKTEASNSANKTLAFDSGTVSILTTDAANTIINSNSLVVYDSVGLLPANPSDGDRAWVTSNNRFYVADSSWHNSLLVNIPPTINIANYDSVLTDSQSLTMTIQVTDSFENPDIISFGATLSPSNITDSAVLSFSRDSSVIAIAMSPDSANDATSFTITFSANDQVNLSTSVKSFTIDKGFVLEQLSQIKGFSTLGGRQIINVDSDLVGGAFQLSIGDVLTDSNNTIEATIVDVAGFSIEHMNALYQNYAQVGASYGATVGAQSAGTFVMDKSMTFDSSHIGRIVHTTSNTNTWKTNFRNGSSTGGQIITHFTEVSAATGASSFSPFTLLGSPLRTNGGLVIGNNVSIPAGYYSFNTDASDLGYIASNRLYTVRQGKSLVWTANISSGNFSYISASVTYWNGRYNYMEYTNTSGVTYFRVTGNQTSFFTAGAQIWGTGAQGGFGARPTARDVVEANHLCVHSSSYNSGGNYTTVYCGNQYGRQINQLHDTGYNIVTFNTGTVSPAVNIGFWKTVNQTGNIVYFEGNSQSVNTGLDVRYGDTVNLSNYYLDREYGVRRTQGGGQYQQNVTLYTETTPAYYRIDTTPSPAGDGSQIDLGTSTLGVYTVKNETAISVDNYAGFTAGKFIKKKT